MIEVTAHEIDLLNHCFSTKTIFDVKLDCVLEARQLLQASLDDPSVRYAVWSLKTLREDLEISGDGPASIAHKTGSYYSGLQYYNTALGGLASSLSWQGYNGLRSALFCCQLFISIEQVRKNYAAMAQHITRGLRIMHEYRARPYLDAANTLMPAKHDHLPLLDVFIIKLFAAPCKFAEPSASVEACAASSSGISIAASPHQQRVGCCELRTIAPDMRTELTRISASTLGFLSRLSQVKSVGAALPLLREKAGLLDSLDSWLADLDLIHTRNGSASPEPVSMCFLRIFHWILRIVLLGALRSSPYLDAELRIANDRLQSTADAACERLRGYRMCRGIDGG